MPSFEATERGYTNLFAKAILSRVAAADKVARRIIANRARYEAVQEKTRVPWAWIGALHDRESGGSFVGVLHNGDRIIGTGKKTYHEPKGRGPFSTWEQAAVDALRIKGFDKITDWSIPRMLYSAEEFNGFGYFGKKVNSPYLWAGTNLQQPGKYIRDGVWDPNKMDEQLGVAAIMLALLRIDPNIFKVPTGMTLPPAIAVGGPAVVLAGTTWSGELSMVVGAGIAALATILYESGRTEKGKAMFGNILANWKTTLAGIAAVAGSISTIATALSSGHLDPTILTGAGTTLITGIGLILGKDANVTGGTKQQ